MSNASKWAAALILCSFSLAFVACGDSSSGTDAGSSGTAGSTGGGGTGGAGGTNATGGRGGGTAGASGRGGTGTTGGGGANAQCQMCVTCAQANCASQVTTCMGNPACNTTWQCATACTMTLNQCIQMNPGGVATFAALAQCANTNCTQNGCPY